VQLSYEMDLSQWTRALSTMRSRSDDLLPAHEKIGDLLVPEIVGNIESQPAEWPPLKPATLERRHAEHPEAGDQMLIVTHALIESISKDAHEAWVDVGSTLKKARTLFFGHGNVPARSPFAWKRGVMSAVGRIYLEHIAGGL